MATKRIKDISTTATTFAADDFIALDASSVGTRKMAKASLITQVGANYLEKADNLSDVASKDTSKLNLEVPNVGTAANEVPVNGMLNSGAWLDFDAFYETGTFTPTLTFGGGSTGMTFLEQGGFYTRIGDTVFVRGIVFLSLKGSSGGSAKLGGLPFTSSAAGSASSVVSVYATSMTALTSSIVGVIDDGGTGIALSDTGATGAADLDETNFGNSSIVRFSATYQIA